MGELRVWCTEHMMKSSRHVPQLTLQTSSPANYMHSSDYSWYATPWPVTRTDQVTTRTLHTLKPHLHLRKGKHFTPGTNKTDTSQSQSQNVTRNPTTLRIAIMSVSDGAPNVKELYDDLARKHRNVGPKVDAIWRRFTPK